MKISGDMLQRHRSLRLLVSLLVVIAAIYAFGLIWQALALFSDVILLFFLAWIISFILEPASLFLQSRGLPRALAVTLIYLALLIVIFSSVVLTVPIIAQQVLLLTNEIARTVSPSNISNLNATLIVLLERFGLSEHDARSVAAQFSAQIPIWAGQLEQGSIGAATALVGSVLGILFSLVLITIISFYMLLDGDRLVESFVLRLPPRWLPDVRLFQDNVQRIFGGFFRAQLIIGAMYGALTWLVLLVLGVPNGLLVGVLAGALMLLPFIGPFLAIVPPIVLVLLESQPQYVAVKVLILLFILVAAQQVVMQVLAPRIFGDSMGIHPLLLFAALLVGAKVSGVWGAFFAGPIVAVAYAMLDVFYWRMAKTAPIFQPAELDEADEQERLLDEPAAEVVIPEAGASSHRNRVPVGMGGLSLSSSRNQIGPNPIGPLHPTGMRAGSSPRGQIPNGPLPPQAPQMARTRTAEPPVDSRIELRGEPHVEARMDPRAEPRAVSRRQSSTSGES